MSNKHAEFNDRMNYFCFKKAHRARFGDRSVICAVLSVMAMCALVVTGCATRHYAAPPAVRPSAPTRSTATPNSTSGGTRGYMEGVVIARNSLMIEGFVLIKGRPGSGFVAGLLSRGGDVKFLPRKEVSGRFSVSYDLHNYVGWKYSITLYAHEADEAGMSKVLATLTRVHR